MIDLPPMDSRIASLPRDRRGYPVPAFVEWLRDGKRAKAGAPGAEPDFRFSRAEFRNRAFKHSLCWVCGQPLGVHKVYAIGPMCLVNRTTSEPASHRFCATFAATACPFLIRPRQKRNMKGMSEDDRNAPGTMVERNPGCVCLYETRQAKQFDAGNGWLIRLGKPDRVDWYAEGRQATRAEIMAAIDSGHPLLLGEAMKEGQESVEELGRWMLDALKLVPAQ
jgi:hypothetical protein